MTTATDVQRRLISLGYNIGGADGVIGPRTLAAILAALPEAKKEASAVMRTSPEGLAALASHEAIVPGPYRDSVGVWTFGIGHTAAAGEPTPADMRRGMPDDIEAAIDDAIRVFAKDIAKYEAEVRAAIRVPVEQHEFDALVSFHYNTGAIGRAVLTQALNRGDRVGATEGFMGWTKPASIRERRVAEQRLFATGNYPRGAITVWGVTAAGGVIWRAQRTLSQAGFIDRIRRLSD